MQTRLQFRLLEDGMASLGYLLCRKWLDGLCGCIVRFIDIMSDCASNCEMSTVCAELKQNEDIARRRDG